MDSNVMPQPLFIILSLVKYSTIEMHRLKPQRMSDLPASSLKAAALEAGRQAPH
jgi:hypothetical protein